MGDKITIVGRIRDVVILSAVFIHQGLWRKQVITCTDR